jgi:peptidoglycan/LPS O-acetylase OafA/YrhL
VPSISRLVLPPGAFRLLLAAAVVVSHVSRLDIGRLAVLLFFYLSGYWVTSVWTTKFGGEARARFYLSRYLRILPLFLLASLGASLLRHWPLKPINFALLGLASTNADPTGVSWSLDIELQFYLLLPILAGLLATHRKWLIVAGTGLATLLGCWIEARFHVLTVAKYLPAFLLGVSTFTEAWKPSQRTALWSLAGFLAVTAITALTPFIDKTRAKPFDQDIWSFLWLLPLVPYVARSLSVRAGALDRDLGNLSFPLYLVHYPIIASAAASFGQSGPVKAAAVGLSLLIAVAVYLGADRPIDAWRIRLTERGGRPAPVVP